MYKRQLLCNASGMLWALVLIHGESWWGAGMAGYLMKASGLWLSHKTQKAQATSSVVDPA